MNAERSEDTVSNQVYPVIDKVLSNVSLLLRNSQYNQTSVDTILFVSVARSYWSGFLFFFFPKCTIGNSSTLFDVVKFVIANAEGIGLADIFSHA